TGEEVVVIRVCVGRLPDPSRREKWPTAAPVRRYDLKGNHKAALWCGHESRKRGRGRSASRRPERGGHWCLLDRRPKRVEAETAPPLPRTDPSKLRPNVRMPRLPVRDRVV